MSNFHDQLEVGKVGESEISCWLQSHGYNILPVYEIAEGQYKGPTVVTNKGTGVIAPDIFAFKNKDVRWIEAKTKSGFSKHNNTGAWTTGIGNHHFENYKEIDRISPWPVWLLFLQKGLATKGCGDNEPGLFGQSIEFLSVHIHHVYPQVNPEMVYWDKETLKKLSDYPFPDESIKKWLEEYNSSDE